MAGSTVNHPRTQERTETKMDQQGQNGLLATYRQSWRNRGWMAWLAAAALTGFYVVLYKTELITPLANKIFAPLASIRGESVHQTLKYGSKWYLYGLLYCVAMVGGGIYYLKRHGNSRYNQLRIATNVTVQILLAFSLPIVMYAFKSKEFYFSYIWPLKIEYLYPQTISAYPVYILLYSALASLVLMPALTLTFGKRWYCSWICGCGGLANTFGDPWRHLSNKSTKAWKFETLTVHTVMVLAVLATILVAADFMLGPRNAIHGLAMGVKDWYGLVVGAILSGIVGVAVYPVLGPRIWCRNFCPMAAMLGLIQKVGRFRIKVKPDMCISCGNCSTYCEMGIDVRSYAQNNQSFTRASCVGCGMCAHMCPRGVLKLENHVTPAPHKDRSGLTVLEV